eukprot:CAMPEP_0170522356 /NCGR_PEP_ID=MMETSP0209-20121228/7775_1 /TAXON_ID=665100 ORGANISM="Litonotus pictus, Strain P1" /NCGR_SAMPLE_ID=MMETSP0209 /ASSEMBLY_ACC=CAM_ASM_000301 /LENGTH=587 /DNA_ID=CAMNT_0010809811 /DNA_START=6004 /DNA_END=7768 /DNA_ORIENTATION=+
MNKWVFFSFLNEDIINNYNTEGRFFNIYLNNQLFTQASPDSYKTSKADDPHVDDVTETSATEVENTYFNSFGALLNTLYTEYEVRDTFPKRFSTRISNSFFLDGRDNQQTSELMILGFKFDGPVGVIVKKKNSLLKPTVLKEGDDFIPANCGDYNLDNVNHILKIYLSTEDDCSITTIQANNLHLWFTFNTTVFEWAHTDNINNLLTELSAKLSVPEDHIHIGNVLRGSAIVNAHIFDYNYEKEDDDLEDESILDLTKIKDSLLENILNNTLNFTFPIQKFNYTFEIVDNDPNSVHTKNGKLNYTELIGDNVRSVIYDIANNVTIDNSETSSVENSETSTSTAIESSDETSNGPVEEEKSWISKNWWVILIVVLIIGIVLILIYCLCCGKKKEDEKESQGNNAMYVYSKNKLGLQSDQEKAVGIEEEVISSQIHLKNGSKNSPSHTKEGETKKESSRLSDENAENATKEEQSKENKTEKSILYKSDEKNEEKDDDIQGKKEGEDNAKFNYFDSHHQRFNTDIINDKDPDNSNLKMGFDHHINVNNIINIEDLEVNEVEMLVETEAKTEAELKAETKAEIEVKTEVEI